MQTWLNFWNLLFWLVLFSFLFNPNNFLNLLLFSEITWLSLYVLTIILGACNDDINLVSFTFFILSLAGLEFAFGFLLLILFKNFNISINLVENNKIFNQIALNNKNALYLENFVWLK